MSEACRFDQNISKGDEGDDFADSRTNPFEEGEDDKNHGVPNGPNGPIAKKIQKNMSTTEFELTCEELN